MRVEPGTVVDRYTFERLLGTGGMAAVYLARHNQLGSLHAVKVLTLPTPAVQQRLLQEGRAQSAFRHPNVVPVTDVIEVGGSPGLVMEFVDGPTLQQLLARHLPRLEQADALARGVLRGVAAAHRHGLVHRDLKPGNVLLAVEDDQLVPKITDFGLAKILHPEPGALETRSGLPMGTPSYMAPEQVRNAAGVDVRADVWALGCILYELVTGARTFLGEDLVDTYRVVAQGRYRSARDVSPDLPERMVLAIEGALQVDPDQRIPDVVTLLDRWSGGRTTGASDHLDASLLAQAREIAADATSSVQPPSGPTFAGGSEETWLEPPASVAPVLPRRRRRWRWPLLGVVAVLGLAAVWAARPQASPILTADGVPERLDPVLQAQLDGAWRALRDAELAEADRRARMVVEGSNDAAALFVRALALDYLDRHGESLDLFWAAVEAAEDEGGPLAELGAAARATRNRSWGVGGQALRAHLERYPRDYLAHLVALTLAPVQSEDGRQLVDDLRALDPSAALLHLLEARRALAVDDFAAAEASLRAGLAANPGAPALLGGLGDVLLRRGRFAEARDALLEALDADRDAVVWTRLAIAHLHLGETEALARVTLHMTTPPTRLGDRVRFGQELAQAYVGLGRIAEGVALLRQAGDAAAEQHAWTTALVSYGTIPVVYQGAEMVEPMRASTVRLASISHQPEIPDAEREMLVRNLLYADGVYAARSGRTDEAAAILGRLRALDRVWPVYVEWLEREVAIARGDADAVPGLLKTAAASCDGDLERGLALFRAGHPSARDVLAGRLADPSGCSQVGFTRFQQAAGHVALAELDPTAAPEHLAAVDRLWPAPDPDLPAALRADALR